MPLHKNDKEQRPKNQAASNSPHYQQEGIASFSPPPFSVTAEPVSLKQEDKDESSLQKKVGGDGGGNDMPPAPPNPPNRNEHILTTLQRKHNAYRPEAKTYQAFKLPTQQKAVQQFKQVAPFQLKSAAAKQGNSNGLPEEVQAKMENTMGHDFSNVNIHQDSAQATDVGALAYAQGNDVHFAPGQFKPATTSGQELIGHELAHVAQQREGRVKPTKVLGKGMAINDDAGLEKEADDMGRKAARGEGPVQTKLSSHSSKNTTVQRFESAEHKDIGDQGSGNTQIVLSPFLTVSYGEITAMAGDYFGSVDEIKGLAAVEGNNGQKVGSVDEINFVLDVFVRETLTEEQAPTRYSAEVISAAETRGNELLPTNWNHFTHSKEGTMNDGIRSRTDDFVTSKDSEGNDVTTALNNTTAYYQAHIIALTKAVELGNKGEPIDDAMLYEAFGSHFLTDAYASGHTRTARYDISAFWNEKIPLFWNNAQWWMAERMAHYINDNNWRGVASKQYIFEQALTTVKQEIDNSGFPPMFLGDVISGALHDMDNENGVYCMVGNEVVKLVGDGQLAKNEEDGPNTLEKSAEAVRVSLEDITKAYAAGKENPNAEAVIASLRNENGLFQAEVLWPQALPDSDTRQANKSIGWKADTVEDLVQIDGISEALNHFFTEKGAKLQGIAAGLADEYQRDAMNIGVVAHMLSDTTGSLTEMVNYHPGIVAPFGASLTAGGQSDNNAFKYFEEAKATEGGLASLTPTQRINLVNMVASGATGQEEEDMIEEIMLEMPTGQINSVMSSALWRTLYSELNEAPLQAVIRKVGSVFWTAQSYTTKLAEIKELAGGPTSQVEQEGIIIILRTCSKAEVKKIGEEVNLDWDLTGAWQDEYDTMK